MRIFFFILISIAEAQLYSGEPDDYLPVTPGKTLISREQNKPLVKPWEIQDGNWEVVDNAIRGRALPDAGHGAVLRIDQKLSNFIVDFQFKLDGAKVASLRIAGDGGHLARLTITPTKLTLQKDDRDHAGPDEAVILEAARTQLAPGEWHQAQLAMVDEQIYARVGEVILSGQHELFRQAKRNPGFTAGGGALWLRNIVIREAETQIPNRNQAKSKWKATRQKSTR